MTCETPITMDSASSKQGSPDAGRFEFLRIIGNSDSRFWSPVKAAPAKGHRYLIHQNAGAAIARSSSARAVFETLIESELFASGAFTGATGHGRGVSSWRKAARFSSTTSTMCRCRCR
jgi:hypothetical protein